MNYSTAVLLINPRIRAIETAYEKDTEGRKAPRSIFKTLDASIKEGDYVIVPTDTRHSKTVVLVTGVDIDIDFESSVQVGWVIDRVNTADHDKIQTEEKKWIEQIKAAEKRRKREEIKKSMLDMYQDEGIEKMAIANMSGITAIEAAGTEE